ncbi:hypothetical protein OU5_2086 [Pseudomonas mandelii JR-1]|uniref:Uncharacterized protein n=1 Tax=Pseudomonas mandelii JR-1 TaxID=1147786 RepID=A0A024E9B7_9PSED|nr:hypothetical protein [Pseudomonas mandelii]AHZ69165.1 hypothetical protein OU5_2086 [Pseudomonas mandelii JR-1]OYQ21863.1 hypothetical protein B7L09_10310 [Pseudomonas mandelii]
MRDSIKATLQAWVSRLEAQTATETDYDDYEYFLDYKVLGAATFLKQVAYQQDDLELLAIATKVEMQVERLIKAEEDAEEEAERERQEMWEQVSEADEQIRAICIRHFYTEPAFSVDMSEYVSIVEASSDCFSDPYKLASLRRYVDEEQVLNKVFEKVKSRLRRTNLSGLVPTFDDVSKAFGIELKEVYRLANAHVERTIMKYAKAQSLA